jgi:hypothetical protein
MQQHLVEGILQLGFSNGSTSLGKKGRKKNERAGKKDVPFSFYKKEESKHAKLMKDSLVPLAPRHHC